MRAIKCYQKLGDIASARQMALKVLQDDPKNAEALSEVIPVELVSSQMQNIERNERDIKLAREQLKV